MIRYCLTILILLLSSCATTGHGGPEAHKGQNPSSHAEPGAPYPEWVYRLPEEKEYLFGLGAGESLEEAREKSIIAIAQQLNTTVKTTLTSHVTSREGDAGGVAQKIDSQLTSQVVQGSRFIDQHKDVSGTYWVLARAPLNCLLDISESLLLSYRLELKQEPGAMEEIVRQLDSSARNEGRTRVPWTPKVPDRYIRVDGLADEWESIPLYYSGVTGDAKKEGTDLAYIKVAMDSRNVYFLLVCNDEAWAKDIVFEIDFHHTGTNRKGGVPGHKAFSNIHSNITMDKTTFWDGDHDKVPEYDPGGVKRIRGPVFEFSIPLKRYNNPSWFNIVYVLIWPTGARDLSDVADWNVLDYQATWIEERAIPAIFR